MVLPSPTQLCFPFRIELPPPTSAFSSGSSYLFGWLPEHISYSAPAPQPVTQHCDNAHQKGLTRVLFVLLRLFCKDQLYESGEKQQIYSMWEKTYMVMRLSFLNAISPADTQEQKRIKLRNQGSNTFF